MIEGQEHLTWERWRSVAALTEELGFESLWRSDHFHSLSGDYEREALETWTSLSVVGAETSRVQLGPLVCSVTFRHPSLLARMAAAVDRVSGGRLVCGIGAGWNEGEHRAFGIPFPPTRARLEMLDEQARILRLLWTGEPVSFEGTHYRLDNARCLPAPAQRRLPLLIGGSGEKRTLRTVAAHADEWNGYGMSLDEHRHKVEVLREHCKELGRDFDSITRSWMCAFVMGRDADEIEQRARGIQRVLSPLSGLEIAPMLEMLRSNGWLVGTPEQVVEQMRDRAAIGIQRFMMQHHDHSDDGALRLLATDVLPALAG